VEDDGKRGLTGVVATVVARPRDRSRVLFDDVKKSRQGWTMVRLYTWKELRSGALRKLEFTQKELADIGLALLVRLVSLERHAERSRRKIRRKKLKAVP
jgi:hypothetical protein